MVFNFSFITVLLWEFCYFYITLSFVLNFEMWVWFLINDFLEWCIYQHSKTKIWKITFNWWQLSVSCFIKVNKSDINLFLIFKGSDTWSLHVWDYFSAFYMKMFIITLLTGRTVGILEWTLFSNFKNLWLLPGATRKKAWRSFKRTSTRNTYIPNGKPLIPASMHIILW